MARGIRRKAIAIALGAILLTPFVAQAEETGDPRMQALEDRMRSLEDRLVTSEATVQAQRELLSAGGTPDVAQGSGLDEFFSGLEFGGHVTSSYSYSFKNPDRQYLSQEHFQFNRGHNTFTLDAVKLELGKPAAEPGTAGFQIDLLWGENAKILRSADPFSFADADLTEGIGDSEVFIQEAYVAYNHEGIELKFGKFETLLGYEGEYRVGQARIVSDMRDGFATRYQNRCERDPWEGTCPAYRTATPVDQYNYICGCAQERCN